MVKITAVIKAHSYVSAIIAFSLLGILTGAVFGISNKTKQEQSIPSGPAVSSKTSAVKVVGEEKVMMGNSPVLFLRLQNTSGKQIKAITISSGRKWVTKSFLLTEESMAPGSIVNQMMPLSSDPGNTVNTSYANERELTIVAVLFDDSTGDGDSRYVQMLMNRNNGVRDQAAGVLSKLQPITNSSQLKEKWGELEAELSLPKKGAKQVSPDYEDGATEARTVLLGRLREVKQSQQNDLSTSENKLHKLKKLLESLANHQ